MNKVTGVLVDVMGTRKAIIQTIEATSGLQGYYDLLNCSLFDIACRKIGENYYDIYCDDEGLLKAYPIVSAIDKDEAPMLVGNLFITKTDDEGNTISLNADEIEEVMGQTIPLFDAQSQIWYTGLVCEY